MTHPEDPSHTTPPKNTNVRSERPNSDNEPSVRFFPPREESQTPSNNNKNSSADGWAALIREITSLQTQKETPAPSKNNTSEFAAFRSVPSFLRRSWPFEKKHSETRAQPLVCDERRNWLSDLSPPRQLSRELLQHQASRLVEFAKQTLLHAEPDKLDGLHFLFDEAQDFLNKIDGAGELGELLSGLKTELETRIREHINPKNAQED